MRIIKVIVGLTSLRKLLLPNNQISGLNPLSGLTNLIYVRLFQNQISNLGPLSGLTNLRTLDLRNRWAD
ncbi:MAG: leucine-rich repeat domain-containing protein [Deltaproteobacteria bacterium]|nr:leucine-rich repeat domain-containing protein [Deltaproteobacteria bacterium]